MDYEDKRFMGVAEFDEERKDEIAHDSEQDEEAEDVTEEE